jgi:thiol-disulfide isomerase/thioredoxin
MKKNVFLIIFILLALIITGSILFKKTTSITQNAKIGMPAPDFILKDIEGKTWKLNELKGKIVILNFWASWCNDCKVEKKQFSLI